MRIAIITDTHANLPALQAALASIRAARCDAILHLGDAIAIGPQPAECLDLLFSTPKMQFVIGNHETYFVDGLPTPQPAWMSDGEVQHQLWTHACLDPQLKSMLAEWPHSVERTFAGVKTAFVHYGLLPSGEGFVPVLRQATAPDLDTMFASHDAVLVFYGHAHRASDDQGRARYVTPGSLGCCRRAVARYCVVELRCGQYSVEHRGVPYDDAALYEAFERRQVPERAFIYRAFLGGRFEAVAEGRDG